MSDRAGLVKQLRGDLGPVEQLHLRARGAARGWAVPHAGPGEQLKPIGGSNPGLGAKCGGVCGLRVLITSPINELPTQPESLPPHQSPFPPPTSDWLKHLSLPPRPPSYPEATFVVLPGHLLHKKLVQQKH